MITKITVWFDGDDKEDCLRCNRLDSRIADFRRVMQKGVTYWEVRNDPTFDDVGGVDGCLYTFYVNEFCVNVVKDLIGTLDEGNMEWYDWFRRKYGMKVAV